MASSDQAQYAIDIAAQLTGGAATIDQLDALTASLTVGGKDAEFFAQAMTTVSKQLDVAKAASAAANAELASGQTQYKALEDAANQAAKAAERAALKNGGLIPADLHAKAEQAKAALDGEALSMARLERAAKAAADEQQRLEGVQKNLTVVQKHVSKNLGDAASRTNKFRAAVGDLGGPLGGLGENLLRPVGAFRELSESFGKSAAIGAAAAVGFAAVAVAVVAVTVAAIAGVAAIASWSVGLADAARTAQEADTMWARQGENLETYSQAAREAADATNLETAALRRLATGLTKAGTSAEDLPKALTAAAQAEKALGQEGAKAWIDSMNAAGASTDEFASEAAKKFGGSVQRQMLGLGEQSKTLKKNFASTFGGLKIDPLLEGLQTLVALFDQNTVAGETIKFLFEEIFQPIIDAVVKAIPLVEAFFIGLLIGATKAYIALKPAIKGIKEFLGFDDETTAETFASFTKAGEYAAYFVGGIMAGFAVLAAVIIPAMVIGLGIMAAGFAVTVTAISALVAGLVWLSSKFWEMVFAVVDALPAIKDAIVDGFNAAVDFILSLDVVQLGLDLMIGFAKGIASGATAVVNAITGAVGGAISAAKEMLGIRSPSRVFAEIGDYTVEGYTDSVESGTASAQAAMADMVEAPSPASLATAASPLTSNALRAADLSAGAAGSGATDNSTTSDASVTVEGNTFIFQGVEGSADAEARFREMFINLMQGNLTQAGGATA